MLYLVIAATLAVVLFIALFDWITTNFEYTYYRRWKPDKNATPEEARVTSTIVSSETHHNPIAVLLAYLGPLSVVGLFALFGEGLRKILSESIVVCDGWVSWLIYAVVGVFAAFFHKCGKESTRAERESLKEKIAEMQERELWNNVEASCEELIKTVDEVLASRGEDDK